MAAVADNISPVYDLAAIFQPAQPTRRQVTITTSCWLRIRFILSCIGSMRQPEVVIVKQQCQWSLSRIHLDSCKPGLISDR
jgi:hypothetical protein